MTNAQKLSPAISVENPTVSRDIYIKYFGAQVEFDCGWYMSIPMGDCELSFMKPQSPEPLYAATLKKWTPRTAFPCILFSSLFIFKITLNYLTDSRGDEA